MRSVQQSTSFALGALCIFAVIIVVLALSMENQLRLRREEEARLSLEREKMQRRPPAAKQSASSTAIPSSIWTPSATATASCASVSRSIRPPDSIRKWSKSSPNAMSR